jgi:hypothetical protein
MSIRIDGTNTTANPGITGGDADTGLQFGTDEVSVVTGGTERVKVDNVETVFTQPTGDAKVRIHAAENNSGSDAELIIETSNDFAESALLFNDSSGVGGSIRYNHGDNATRFLTNGTSERMRIQSGGGISFNGDTAAANALDDYEEGVWEPRFFNNANGAITVSTVTRAAKYVKIGRTVYITCYIQCSSKGTNTGNVTLDNLPYATDSNGQLHGALVVSFFSGMTASHSTLCATAQPSSNTILLRKVASTADSSVSTLVASQINNGFDLIVGGSYITAI